MPTAVKQTIDQQSAGGTVKRIEKVTRGKSVSYEAAIVKNGIPNEASAESQWRLG